MGETALLKAEVHAQERPISEQIKNTQLFLDRKRKRVEQSRQDTMQAREALSKALAVQEEQETLLARREEVGHSPGERESNAISVHCPRTRGVSTGSGRVLPIARYHRRFAEGVGESSLSTASTINVVGGRRGRGCRSSQKNPKWDHKPLWLSHLVPREHQLRSREVMAREVAATFHVEVEEFSNCGLLWTARQSCWGGTESRSDVIGVPPQIDSDAFAPVLPGRRTLLRRLGPFAPARHSRFTPTRTILALVRTPRFFLIVEIHAQTIEEVWWWKSHPMLWMRPQLFCRHLTLSSLELDLRVPAFDPVDSDDEFDDAFPRDVSGGAPVEAAVEPAGFGARHSGRFAVLATDVDDDDLDTAHDSPNLVDALEFDLTRTDHEEVLVQSIVVDHDNVSGTVEDNQVSADSAAPVTDVDGGREAIAHSQPQRRRLVLVNSAPVLDASLDHGFRESDTDTVDWEEVVAQDVHAEVVVEPELPVPDFPSVAMRTGFRSLDAVQLKDVFVQRASVMQHIPVFLKGPFRNALRVALSEILEGSAAGDELREERGWKLFFLLPRMLLSGPPRGGHISKDKLSGRFAEFGRGHWLGLIRVGMDCAEASATASRRRRRSVVDDIDRRAARAKMLVQ